MLNTCPHCGAYRVDKSIDPAGPSAICPDCGHAEPFRQLPLLLIGGPSGAGKTAVLRALIGRIDEAVLLESDILWRSPFNTPDDNYRDFFETWLRMAKNVGQSGRPVVLFGAGFVVPGNIEPCVERRYFSTVSYLALVADETTLTDRLKARPAWRESGGDGFVESQLAFNRWLRSYDDDPPITRLDTSDTSVAETIAAVAVWIRLALGRDMPAG